MKWMLAIWHSGFDTRLDSIYKLVQMVREHRWSFSINKSMRANHFHQESQKNASVHSKSLRHVYQISLCLCVRVLSTHVSFNMPISIYKLLFCKQSSRCTHTLACSVLTHNRGSLTLPQCIFAWNERRDHRQELKTK